MLSQGPEKCQGLLCCYIWGYWGKDRGTAATGVPSLGILGQSGRAATATSSVTEFQGFISLWIIFYLRTCN